MEPFLPVDDIRDARSRKKRRQAFYTPLPVIETMLSSVRCAEGVRALEPSAGDGRIVHALLARGNVVHACEIDDAMYARCANFGVPMIGTDFLSLRPNPHYELIVMNPPFTGGQARMHIEHAYRFLRPHAELVAIAPTSMAAEIQAGALDLPGCQHVVYERLPAKAFAESGTGVETLMVWIDGPTPNRECCGFTNGPTANAVFTIDSDRDMHAAARQRPEPAALRTLAAKSICESGGSVYGVDWQDVADHFAAVALSEREPAVKRKS